MTSKKWYLPEVWFTAALLGLVMMLSMILGFPVHLPQGDQASFVGIHYLYPLAGLAVWGLVAFVGQRRNLAKTFLVALPCYAVVLVCHFNLKLWAPHINPTLWDSTYWRIDTALHPIVATCFAIRRAIAPVIPLESNLYLTAFITMFYVSFCFHAVRSTHDFRTLFLAALLFQGLGALAYLVMPALGPFTFEQGVEPLTTGNQQAMLAAYHANMAGGAQWIAAQGGTFLVAGVAAMPSLHAGGSFLFLRMAWRHARVLVPLYSVLFGYIAIDAIATRWHYLLDLPAGIALALFCVWAAEKLNPRTEEEADLESNPGRPDAIAKFFVRLRRKFGRAAA